MELFIGFTKKPEFAGVNEVVDNTIELLLLFIISLPNIILELAVPPILLPKAIVFEPWL